MAAPVRATIMPVGVQAVMVRPYPVVASPVAPSYRWAASVLAARRPLPATVACMSPVAPKIDPPTRFPLGPCGRQIAGFLPVVYWRRKTRAGWQIYPNGRNR